LPIAADNRSADAAIIKDFEVRRAGITQPNIHSQVISPVAPEHQTPGRCLNTHLVTPRRQTTECIGAIIGGTGPILTSFGARRHHQPRNGFNCLQPVSPVLGRSVPMKPNRSGSAVRSRRAGRCWIVVTNTFAGRVAVHLLTVKFAYRPRNTDRK